MTRRSPGVVLYRLGDPTAPDSFWATDSDYPAYVHPESDAPLWTAVLPRSAKIQRVAHISGTTLADAKRCGRDGVSCPCWDFEGDEYVVFRPEILVGVRRA